MTKNVYLWITGVLVGFLIMLGIYTYKGNKAHTREIIALNDSIETLLLMAPDTVVDTAWNTIILHKPIPRPYPVHDTVTVEVDSEICQLRWYQDTLRFEDLTLAYQADVIGELNELHIDYQNLRPEIVYIKTNEPVKPTPYRPQWSVNGMVGYPLGIYAGVQYDPWPQIGFTGGIFAGEKQQSLLLGMRFRVK